MDLEGEECTKCGSGEFRKEGLPEGYWVECDNCGFIPGVE